MKQQPFPELADLLPAEVSDDWWTPANIVLAAIATLGEIDLDPCSNPEPHNIPAREHFTEADDGLSREWRGRCWVNPPYSAGQLDVWTAKLWRELSSGRVSEAILLVPAYTDTGWFQTLWLADALCFVKGRLSFIGAGNYPARFPNVLAYWGANTQRFATAYAPIGHIVRPRSTCGI